MFTDGRTDVYKGGEQTQASLIRSQGHDIIVIGKYVK